MRLLEAIKTRWVIWVWNHTPTCAEMTRLTSQSFEQPPSLKMRLKMRLHHVICVWCERYKKHLTFLHHAAPKMREEATETSGRGLSHDARRRIIERLRQPGD